MKSNFDINILLLAFNRFEETSKVVDALSRIDKANIYISMDGPRNDSDRRNQQKIIDYVAKHLGPNVRYQILDQNHGCRAGVTLGITWFFYNVKRGVIIEDDCVPTAGAISYISAALNDFSPKKHSSIVGTNYFSNDINIQGDTLIQSYYTAVWGWGTWRENWFDFILSKQKHSAREIIYISLKRFKSAKLANLLAKANWHESKGLAETWDYGWFIHTLMSGKPNLLVTNNLFSNIGYEGVHGRSKTINNDLAVCEINPLPETAFTVTHHEYDYKIGRVKFESTIYDYVKLFIKICLNR